MGWAQRYIDRLESELDRERLVSARLQGELNRMHEHERLLLERLAFGEPETPAPMSPPLSYTEHVMGPPLTGSDRPEYATPQWTPDGLSSSLDDDPLPAEPDADFFVGQPDDAAYHDPVPEVEEGSRQRVESIRPGENPFAGLAGLDPDA